MGKFGFAKQDEMAKGDVEAAPVPRTHVVEREREKKTFAEAKPAAKPAAKPEGKDKPMVMVKRRKPDRGCVNFTLATSLLINLLFFICAGVLVLSTDVYDQDDQALQVRKAEYESAMACNAALSDLYKRLFRKISELNGHLIGGRGINYDQIESMRQAYEDFNKAGTTCKFLAPEPVRQKPCGK